MRPIVWQGLSLSTIGVLVTALLMGVFVAWVQGFSFLEGLLLGAIVSSTDAAAVFMVLRARKTKIPRRLIQLLEFESGSNDPMAVVLTIALIRLLTEPSTSFVELVVFFVMQMGVGTVIGIAMGEIMRRSFNALDLELEGIYPVLSLALALLTYGLTDYLEGSGFLAVYLAGLVMAAKTVYSPAECLAFSRRACLAHAGHHVLNVRASSISRKARANRRRRHPDFPFPHLHRPPCECPRGAGVVADVVSRADACGVGGAPWGRADYLGHISHSSRDREGRHDLSFGVFYRAHVRRHAGDSDSVTDANVEDRSPSAQSAVASQTGAVDLSWFASSCGRSSRMLKKSVLG